MREMSVIPPVTAVDWISLRVTSGVVPVNALNHKAYPRSGAIGIQPALEGKGGSFCGETPERPVKGG